ncbi:MAG: hypothetical protein M1596_04845 [Firmicutes bacterium]|nr:hypothetical protein [Bacillota bacterium]
MLLKISSLHLQELAQVALEQGNGRYPQEANTVGLLNAGNHNAFDTPSLKGGESCEERVYVSFTRKGLAKSPLSGRLKVSGYLELIVRRIRLTSGLDDAIYFTPPTMAGDNRQYILLSKSEHI